MVLGSELSVVTSLGIKRMHVLKVPSELLGVEVIYFDIEHHVIEVKAILCLS
jgi:hypothetical protein